MVIIALVLFWGTHPLSNAISDPEIYKHSTASLDTWP